MITAWGLGRSARGGRLLARGEVTTGDARDTLHVPRICFAFNCKLLAQFQVLG